MLLGYSQCFGEVPHVRVHLDGEFGFLGLDEAVLGFGELSAVNEILGLIHQDVGYS